MRRRKTHGVLFMVRTQKAATRGADLRLLAVVALGGAGLSACAGVPSASTGASLRTPTYYAPTAQAAARSGGSAERALGRYKVGAPYEVGGLWYVPAEQPAYDEVGVASWYGDDFNGKPTANGEIFNMHGVSGAHATLPMPAIVEVTNLENGKTIRVRMNDRGPFVKGRLIDLSRGGADQLGFLAQGTAQVRVQYVGPAKLDGSLEPLFEVARSEKPAPRPAQPAPPLRTASLQGEFGVQAGAFADRSRAERVAADLASAGKASIRPVQVAGSTLYRVVVGPWLDAHAAERARAQVATLGFAEARVIRTF